jgi:thioredoxin 1
MTTHKATDGDFEAVVLNSTVPVIVDFWAEWCGPCRMLSPILDEAAGELGDTAKIVKVNIDESPDLAEKYGVRSIPTLILFKDGKSIETRVGNQPKSKIVEWAKGEV